MNQCIFCEIVKGNIPSFKIFEDNELLVVLDINPASKGHCLIISKEHDKVPENLGKTIKLIIENFKEKINLKSYSLLKKAEIEHFVLQFIPVNEGKEVLCQVANKQGNQEELKKLAEELKLKEKKEIKQEENEKVVEIKGPKIIEGKKLWYINP
ncbi:MAG: HIT domain-containing protein [Nanoarchaeota archaeon]